MSHYRKCLMYILHKLEYLTSEEHKNEVTQELKKEYGENSFCAESPHPYIVGEIKAEIAWTKYMLSDDISILERFIKK